MARVELTFQPRLLAGPEAARYIGISEANLRTLGLPRRILGKRRLYDRYDLDAFVNSMEIEGQQFETLEEEQAECDKLFGAGS